MEGRSGAMRRPAAGRCERYGTACPPAKGGASGENRLPAPPVVKYQRRRSRVKGNSFSTGETFSCGSPGVWPIRKKRARRRLSAS